MTENEINEITGKIVKAAFKVHTELGPRLLESVYERALASELEHAGLHVVRQQPVPVQYRGLELPKSFRADLIVERVVVVEVKSRRRMSYMDAKQLLNYLRLLDYRVGLLFNFGAARLRNGIKRMVNKL
jgi:GxxExxY protein